MPRKEGRPRLHNILFLSLLCASSLDAQRYSLVVGIDGLGSYGIHAAETPNIDSLIEGSFGDGTYQGAFAQHSFAGGVIRTSSQQATSSGPSWASILTGVWDDQHGVTDNSFSSSRFRANPSYLETLEENVGSLYSASAITWAPIDTHVISTVDDANSSMDFRTTGSDATNATVAARQISRLRTTDSAALFVHLDDVDGSGHRSGSYSSGYLNQVAEIDTQVGQMLIAIQNRPNFSSEDWQIVITADHGHRPAGGHGGQTALERTVPIVISSKSVAQGFAPTTQHLTSIVDVAPTVLNHFGVAVPNHYAGRALGMTAVDISTWSLVSNGLISHLALDGNAFGTLAGSGGTIHGDVEFRPGIFGQAASVENYGDGFIRLNDDLGDLFGSNADFSMSLWLKFDSFTGDPAFLSNKNWNSGRNNGINLAFNPNNTLDFNAKTDRRSRQDVHPLNSLSPHEWQNIVFTVDADDMTTLFIDGVIVGAIDSASNGSFDNPLNWVLLNDGTGNYEGTVEGLMVDEFASWNRTLTLDEVSILSQTNLKSIPQPCGRGDITCDGNIDAADIDSLSLAIRLAEPDFNSDWDLDANGRLEFTDQQTLVNEIIGTTHGDADLNGSVEFADFLALSSSFGEQGGWSHGDFDASGDVTFADFLVLSANFGATAATTSVPEPSGCALAWIASVATWLSSRKRDLRP